MLNSLSENDHDRLSRLAAIGVSAAAAALCLYLAVRILWLLVPRADAPVVASMEVCREICPCLPVHVAAGIEPVIRCSTGHCDSGRYVHTTDRSTG